MSQFTYNSVDYGLVDSGLRVPRFPEIRSMLSDDLKEIFGQDIALGPDSKFGQLADSLAERYSSIYDLLEAVYLSFDPELSHGQSLTRNCRIIGVHRHEGQKSTVSAKLYGVQGTLIKAGALASTASGQAFQLTQNVILSVAPTGQETDYHGVGLFEAVEYGASYPLANELNIILKQEVGWKSVINPADGTPGREEESDTDLRLRRKNYLQAGGNGKADAIKAAIENLSFGPQVRYFENDTDQVSSRGQAPYSLEIFVIGAETAEQKQEVADIIWQTRGTNPRFVGGENFTVVDSEGFSHTMRYSIPTDQWIWLDVSVKILDTELYSEVGAKDALMDAIKVALVTRGAELSLGDDVVCDPFLKGALRDFAGIQLMGFGIASTDKDASAPTVYEEDGVVLVDDTKVSAFDTTRILVSEYVL